MVDFDDLKGKAESLLGEHGDQVEEGIDKLAGLAGQKFGHAGQIDEAADKLKDLVDKQQQGTPQPAGHGNTGARQAGGQRPAGGRREGGGPRPGGRPQGKQGGRPRPGGDGPRRRPGPGPESG